MKVYQGEYLIRIIDKNKYIGKVLNFSEGGLCGIRWFHVNSNYFTPKIYDVLYRLPYLKALIDSNEIRPYYPIVEIIQ